jgi:hypothetical protein
MYSTDLNRKKKGTQKEYQRKTSLKDENKQ